MRYRINNFSTETIALNPSKYLSEIYVAKKNNQKNAKLFLTSIVSRIYELFHTALDKYDCAILHRFFEFFSSKLLFLIQRFNQYIILQPSLYILFTQSSEIPFFHQLDQYIPTEIQGKLLSSRVIHVKQRLFKRGLFSHIKEIAFLLIPVEARSANKLKVLKWSIIKPDTWVCRW